MSTSFKEDEISKTTLRIRALQRLFWWHCLSKRLPLFLVTEFPKSGGTWYAKMLSECIEIPFPPALDAPRYQSMILRDTKLYNSNFNNLSVVMRDGRDVMVSSYYHFLFPNEANLSFAVEEKRNLLGFSDFDDVVGNMPKFIEYMFEIYPKKGWGTRFSWADFVDSWAGRDAPIIKYEELLSQPVESMQRMVREVANVDLPTSHIKTIVDKYSFKSITGRDNGKQNSNSFARKGISGDWKNYFNSTSRSLFQEYAGPQLIKLGYEEDGSWAKETTVSEKQ